MHWFDWLVIIFAIDAMLVLWFRGEIFAPYRATAEAWADSPKRFKSFVGKALTCPLCLPFHLAFWLALYFVCARAAYSASWLVSFVFDSGMRFILQVLATGGIVNRIYNDLFPYTNQLLKKGYQISTPLSGEYNDESTKN